MNLPIKARIILSFAFMSALIVSAAIVGHLTLRSSVTGANQYKELANDSIMAGEVEANLLLLQTALDQYLFSGQPEAMDEFQFRLAAINLLLKTHKSAVISHQASSIIDRLTADIKNFADSIDQISDLNLRLHNLEEELTALDARIIRFDELFSTYSGTLGAVERRTIDKALHLFLNGRITSLDNLQEGCRNNGEKACQHLGQAGMLLSDLSSKLNTAPSALRDVVAEGAKHMMRYPTIIKDMRAYANQKNNILKRLNSTAEKARNNIEITRRSLRSKLSTIDKSLNTTFQRSTYLLTAVLIGGILLVLLIALIFIKNIIIPVSQLEGIINKSHAVAFLIDLQKKQHVKFVSKNVDQFGYSRRDFYSGKISMFQLLHPDDRERVQETIRQYKEKGENELSLTYRIVTASGATRWIADRTWVVREASGEVKAYQGVLLDITGNKLAEEELRRLKSLLGNIIDSMPSALVGVDQLGRVNQWNLGAEKATGLNAKDTYGKMLVEVYPRLAGEMERVHTAIKNREPQENLKVPRTEKGETEYEDVTVYPLIANGVVGAVIRVDNVTARVRIEEMMIQTEKMMSVGGLAAGMAHEINNPLGIILQAAQSVERRFSRNIKKNVEAAQRLELDLDKIHEYMEERGILQYLEGIKEAGQRAAAIVKNMLNFSRKSESLTTRHSLNGILDKAIALAANDYSLRRKFDFKKIEIVRDYDQSLPPVAILETEIEQVFLNLLKNAAQAIGEMEQRESKPTINIRTSHDEKFVKVEIQDNGPGMDSKTKKRIFEPFFTTKPVGAGTGLGLSVSYFIITQNHQGEFMVQSLPGHGTTFSIKLPR